MITALLLCVRVDVLTRSEGGGGRKVLGTMRLNIHSNHKVDLGWGEGGRSGGKGTYVLSITQRD